MPHLDIHFESAGPNVHVWALRLAASADQIALLERGLPDDERALAGTYSAESARNEFIVTRAALRTLLAGYLNQPSVELRFAVGPRGKPALAASAGIAFNVSHSRGMALLALATGGAVGVDVEATRPLPDLPLLVERVFKDADARRWRALPPAEQLPAFYRAWTRKEACAKASGDGLWADIRAIEVDFAAGAGGDFSAIGEAAGWALHDIAVGNGHIAALACARGVAPAAPLRWLDAAALR